MKIWPLALLLTLAPLAAQAADPSAAQTQAARQRGPCSDPWVTIALEQAYGRADRLLCHIKLYNNGSWGSYDQLLGYVRGTGYGNYTFQVMTLGGGGPLAGRQALGVLQGGRLVAAGGGNLVAAGGGNLVAAGGGNIHIATSLVSPGGGSLVSPGGGSYSLQNVRSVPAPVVGQ